MNQTFKGFYGLLVAGALSLTLMAGCGGGGGGSSSGENTSGGDEVLASKTIGPDGGILSMSDAKMVLNIPAGALSSDTNITISSNDLQGTVGNVYELGPSGTTFVQPVEVTIVYDPTALPANTAEDDLYLLTESEDGYMEALTDIIVDKTTHKITGKLLHFSPVWIAIPKLVVDSSNQPLMADTIPIATSFRMPIGDSRDFSNTAISCNDGQSQSSEDFGNNLNLLTISSYSSNSYPKTQFNASDTSNIWIVGTAFNKNQYLTNYDTGSVGLYNNSGDFHPGEDWNGKGWDEGGRPIHAIADGIILFSQKQWKTTSSKSDKTTAFGNIVVIGHKLNDGRIIASVYAHMKDISLCSVGKKVNKGDIIGLIGTTGHSTANHLHFEIIKTALVEKASSKVWQLYTPAIDSATKQIYIRYSKSKDKSSETIAGEEGWYWPKTDTKITDHYENPSNFIKAHSYSDTITPSAPTNLTASATSSSQINLSWTASTDNVAVAGYKIYETVYNGNDTPVGTSTTTSYSVTGLNAGTMYCYVVSAYDASGNEAKSSSACAITKGTGTLQGYVKDAVTRSGLSGATINVYDTNGVLTTSLTTDSSGVYTKTLATGTYSLNITKTGYISENISNVTIQENVTTTVETVLQVSTAYSGTGTISGTIKNALDGNGVSGVTINFRSGINTTTGSIVATTTTGTYGTYTVTGLNAGNYTGEATKSGFTTAYFTVTAIGGQTNYNQDATITPILSSGETRIVLTWGATPYDLDSHLTGPISGSTSRFHVYFSYKGNSTSSPYAALDVDDTSSYGPETTTIYQQFDGIYRYSVHNFSNRGSSSSYALSNSGATVKVYRGSSLVATFNVPVNQGGTLWTVIEMSGDTITPISTMSYKSSSSAVQAPILRSSQLPVYHSDAPLMRNLPEKR